MEGVERLKSFSERNDDGVDYSADWGVVVKGSDRVHLRNCRQPLSGLDAKAELDSP